MKGVNYSVESTVKFVPPDYKCGKCGATGIKLWREYMTVNPRLLCAVCASEEENENIADIDSKGIRTGKYDRTDQISGYVPAVPDEEGVGYWGYTSVPPEGVNWWKALPTLKEKV